MLLGRGSESVPFRAISTRIDAIFTVLYRSRAFYRDLPTPKLRQAYTEAFLGRAFQNDTAARGALRHIEYNWADQPYTRGDTPLIWSFRVIVSVYGN